MIVDTHCHLDSSRYSDDLEDVIERAESEGVKISIIPGADPKDLQKAVEIAERYENIYFSVGIHPYHSDEWDSSIFQYSNHKKCVAVGECGLDYYRLPEDEQEKIEEVNRQKRVFREQIKLAKELKKPLIIHIRDASVDAKEILLEEGADEVGGVLHCYNADEVLLSLSEKGFYFGIGGVLTFKNAKKLVNVLPKIPREKLLVETDAPYLTPHPHRGKRNEPAYTKLVVEKIAQLLNTSEEIVERETTESAYQLFKLKEIYE
jgi:TatD DNase family protein